jgi:hypothetical protein
VAFIDLPPTVFSLAGIDIPDQFQGRAFAGEAAEPAEEFVFLFGQRFDSRMLRFVRGVTDGEYRYIRNFHPHRHRGIYTGYPHGQIGWQSLFRVRQDGGLNDIQSAYWTVPQPTEELYHTGSDPWELKNLANDPSQRERLETMRAATLNKMREIRDTGIVPESMYTKLSKKGTVAEYVHSQDFPYDTVLKLALLAGDGDSGSLPELEKALGHAHPVMRYWAAVGCTIRGEQAASAKEGLAALLTDSSESVRLAASEAIYALGDTKTGFQSIVSILAESSDPIVTLEALNLTQAIGRMNDVPSDVWSKACKTGDYTQRMAKDPLDPNLQALSQ